MNLVAHLAARDRRDLFSATAERWAITPAAAEKDFWIVWVMWRLFSLPEWSSRLRFKGGTSLSKAYNVIQRFSEDIDLILSWQDLTARNPNAERSKSQQLKLNQTIIESAQTIIREQLLPDVQRVVGPVCAARLEEDDPHTIAVHYPAEFAPGYLRPVVRLEVGPLAAMLPMEKVPVQSYVAKSFPQLFRELAVEVPTISIERTFWEKLTILHAESHRPAEKHLPLRYARHYYDVHCLMQSSYAQQLLNSTHLLADVVSFKQKFYPASWANYQTATLSGLSLMPAPAHQKSLEADYQQMAEMIFGAVPRFTDILNTLHQLQMHFRNS